MTSLQSAAVLRPDPRPIPADGLGPECFWRGVHRAETGSLQKEPIMLLLASEYQMSATAIVLKVVFPPRVSVDGMVRVIS